MPQPHRPLPPLAVALGLAALLHAPVFAQQVTADSHAGMLKSVQGDVQVYTGDRAAPARVGAAVDARQRIVTGPQSGASVVLRDGTALVIGPQSSFDLQTFRYDPSTHDGSVVGSLMRGTLRMVTGLIGKARPEAVRIDTPTATIGIRGTDFIVNAGDTL